MDPFVAEIRIFPFGQFAPRGWAFCDGQILPLSQNTALFSLLGTNFGGDGIRTFALPNMHGRVPMHTGNGNGLTPRVIGEEDGTETVTLTSGEMPNHNHGVVSVPGNLVASTNKPGGNSFGRAVQGNPYAPPPATPNPPTNPTPMAALTIGVTGNNLPHNNMQPYLTLSFCIAMQGVFPPRT
jgi:microcystin-dependent protein